MAAMRTNRIDEDACTDFGRKPGAGRGKTAEAFPLETDRKSVV